MKLKKLSKSEQPIHHEVEVFQSSVSKNKPVAEWLWACQHGCFDNTEYDMTDRKEAEKLANKHRSIPRSN